MFGKKCSCCGGHGGQGGKEYTVPTGKQLSLAELPVGVTATIVKIMPETRGRKKFADVGLVAGAELLLEARAPFGGLLRVKVLETSMALHRDDAAGIVMKREDEK